MAEPYNPLDRTNLGRSIADALIRVPRQPLETMKSFSGAGVYAIYYTGDFPCYRTLSDICLHDEIGLPIYVGKAIPEGARKGDTVFNSASGRSLYDRLSKHRNTIRDTPGLSLGHFDFRYLVVEDIWIPLGESLMIARYSPVWNTIAAGFGNNPPGKGREEQVRSRWHTLHPASQDMRRTRSGELKPLWPWRIPPSTESVEVIAAEIEEHIRSVSEALGLLPPG